MPTALRDMQPWRRSLVEQGLTLPWLAEATDTPLSTVKAYSGGFRNPPESWIERAEKAIAEVIDQVAPPTAEVAS